MLLPWDLPGELSRLNQLIDEGKIHVNFELFRGMNLSSQTGACIDLNKLDIQYRKEALNASNSFRQFQPMNLSAIESQLNLCD